MTVSSKGLTVTKILKQLRKDFPQLHWIRQAKYDVPENDEHGLLWAFAGLKGKQGIRFSLVAKTEKPVCEGATQLEVSQQAKLICQRLIRGEA